MTKNYLARGTPWTVVIDSNGIVRFSRWTQRNMGPIRATIQQGLRQLAKSKKG